MPTGHICSGIDPFILKMGLPSWNCKPGKFKSTRLRIQCPKKRSNSSGFLQHHLYGLISILAWPPKRNLVFIILNSVQKVCIMTRLCAGQKMSVEENHRLPNPHGSRLRGGLLKGAFSKSSRVFLNLTWAATKVMADAGEGRSVSNIPIAPAHWLSLPWTMVQHVQPPK